MLIIGKNTELNVYLSTGHVGPFKWSEYFTESSIIPVPAHLFTEVCKTKSNLVHSVV